MTFDLGVWHCFVLTPSKSVLEVTAGSRVKTAELISTVHMANVYAAV